MALSHYPPADVGALQQADRGISEVLAFWWQKLYPSREERKQLSQLALVLLKQWDQRAGVASRQVLRSDGWEEILQVLLPAALKEKVLIEVHQNHGHQGVNKTLELLRLWCYWPRMSSNVRRWCQTCERCQVAKDSGPLARSFLGHLLASEPK